MVAALRAQLRPFAQHLPDPRLRARCPGRLRGLLEARLRGGQVASGTQRTGLEDDRGELRARVAGLVRQVA